MKKILLSFVVFTAIIRSSEVKDVNTRRYGTVTRLCANYDIQQNGKTIENVFQCGDDWTDIEYGIRLRLKQKQEDANAIEQETNRVHHLYVIKNDEVGKVIKP